MKLESPEIIKHGTKFGVKFKAKTPSIHLIRVDRWKSTAKRRINK